MAYVLILNCGSSSLKFSLMDEKSESVEVSGLAERLGEKGAVITTKFNGEKIPHDLGDGSAHQQAVEYILNFLTEKNFINQVKAIGHRVVHGGEKFTSSVLIDANVLKAIETCTPLAPLHNPANLVGINAAMKAFPSLPQVAVFDTAFHQTMPEKAFLYAIPMDLYRKDSIRRYGFHGTSHRFIAQKTIEFLNLPKDNNAIISAHLGNGASIAAILNGKSVDTSMGLTPLEGLVMGTRSGSIDPGVFNYLANKYNMSVAEIDTLLNKKSGLLGLSEISNDCRTIEEEAAKGNKGAIMALEVFCYRLAKMIASYLVPLGKLDALVFTGGIGENDVDIRKKVINYLSFLGFTLDESANQKAFRGGEGVIASSPNFGKAIVLSTDEELMIVRDTLEIVG